MRKEPIAFSIIICTYQTDLYRTLLSIDSVLAQDFQSYELIITDDGSENTNFKDIEAYLKAKGFEKYKLIGHTKNLGTVESYYDALSRAAGRYVKGLGGGDMLYGSHTLQTMYRFMEKERCELAFGGAQTYAVKDHTFLLGKAMATPRNLAAYTKGGRWLQSLDAFACMDWIPGVQNFGKLQTIRHYIKKLRGISKYTEDIFQLLIYHDKLKYRYCNQMIVWYEQGSGISTSGSLAYNKYLRRDVAKVYGLAYSNMRNHIFQSKAFMFTIDDLLSFCCGKLKYTAYESSNGFLYQKEFQDEVIKTWEGLGLTSNGHGWKKEK